MSKPTPFASLFVFLCAAYLLLLGRLPPLPAAAAKVLPIAMLAARSAARARGTDRVCLVLALLSSLVGDAILAIAPDSHFVQGVAAFFVAHVLYIVAFARRLRYSKRSAMLAAVVVAWCLAVASVLFPRLGALRAPVSAYMLVIAGMGVSAAFATGARATLVAGAFAFILSDSILAADRFVAHFELVAYLVMVTYYFGQYQIVAGVLHTEHDRRTRRSIPADRDGGKLDARSAP